MVIQGKACTEVGSKYRATDSSKSELKGSTG